ncbi:MAG TPA: beta-ketoacyl synthase N-terminal-like domain-containing protein [Thermoanaerobaculia bacterium]|jgi:3-oxoacyl-(acyl-carrier-protein) synthase|nr:beta-ketoacyl synthase N-terminal-like domain-containing protein [Thermoanaerobaculia bacterium]
MTKRKRVGIFGWGIVAPKSPDMETFARNLEEGGSWLTPFRGFGPSNFLVGEPEFDFERYRPWFDERFPPAKFAQLKDKMGPMVHFAMGAFIQSLEQNPGIEQYLQSLGIKAHVYVGTGVGELTVIHEQSRVFDRAIRRWNEFWAAPERCEPLRRHLEGTKDLDSPRDPGELRAGSEEWIDAKYAYEAYWMAKSDALQEYLAEARAIQSEPVPPSTGASSNVKLTTIRQKLNRIRQLNKKWGCPEEPWAAVSPNLLWNIANIPAAQISMIGKIVGPSLAPVAACASFGVAAKLADEAIQLGEATAVVIGMTDPPPHGLFISGFYNANVVSADADVSRPMTGLKGTHVSGGACVWILGDADALMAQGFKPVGLEIVGIGTSSDAHHIITPSKGGPQLAIKAALDEVQASEVTTWDMHATATPGDATEIEHSLEMLHPDVLFTARKGTFGHGLSVGGGWELTAQHLGLARGKLFPVPLTEGELHADVKVHSAKFVQVDGCRVDTDNRGYSGKLSMGIGGINSCVISRPWDPAYIEAHVAQRADEEAVHSS